MMDLRCVKNKIRDYALVWFLTIVFLLSAIVMLIRPTFSMNLIPNLTSCAGEYLADNIILEEDVVYYKNVEDNQSELYTDAVNFLARVNLPHLPFGVYRYDIHYASSTDNPCSIWTLGDDYDAYYSNISGLWDYKSSTWSFIDIRKLRGADGMFLCIVAEDYGECIIDSFTIREYYPWRIGVLLAEAFLFAVIFWLWYRVRFWDKSRRIILCVNAAVVIIMCLPMFFCGCETLGGDDYNFHLSRIATIVNEISYGHFPVLYQSDSGLGAGYLAFVMYGNIFMYVPAFFYAMGLPLSASIYVYFALVNVLTTYLAWLCFKNIFTDYRLALVATALYSLAPYRLTNIYSRATAGETIAMAFFPLVMYGMMKIYRSEERPNVKEVLPLVLGMTGLINCHILSTELACIALFIYVLTDLRTTFKRIKSLALAVVMTIFVNLFFIFPFIQSYGMNLQCKYEGLIPELPVSGLKWQAFVRPFIYVAYSADNNRYYAWDEVMVGLPFTLGIVAFLCIYVSKKIKRTWNDGLMFRLAVLGIVSMILTTIYFPWGWFQGKFGFLGNAFTAVQFPWRYLSLVSLFMAPVTAWAIGELFINKRRVIVSGIVVGFAATVAIVFSLQVVDRRAHSVSTSAASALYGDHLYLLEQVAPTEDMAPHVTPEDGAVVKKRGADEHNMKMFEVVSASEDSWVTVPIVAYDYMRTTSLVDGTLMTTKINEDNGLLSVFVPEGYAGIFGVDYAVPGSWKLSYLVSGIAWLGIVAISIRKKIVVK